eukprot:1180086-Prorocentrum_minimum.AAC.6
MLASDQRVYRKMDQKSYLVWGLTSDWAVSSEESSTTAGTATRTSSRLQASLARSKGGDASTSPRDNGNAGSERDDASEGALPIHVHIAPLNMRTIGSKSAAHSTRIRVCRWTCSRNNLHCEKAGSCFGFVLLESWFTETHPSSVCRLWGDDSWLDPARVEHPTDDPSLHPEGSLAERYAPCCDEANSMSPVCYRPAHAESNRTTNWDNRSTRARVHPGLL